MFPLRSVRLSDFLILMIYSLRFLRSECLIVQFYLLLLSLTMLIFLVDYIFSLCSLQTLLLCITQLFTILNFVILCIKISKWDPTHIESSCVVCLLFLWVFQQLNKPRILLRNDVWLGNFWVVIFYGRLDWNGGLIWKYMYSLLPTWF